MLDFYFSPEDLESKYKCVDCDEKVDATKFYKIAEPPRLLTIQLKRFSFKRKGSKNESQVDFPLTGLILSTASSLTAEELSAMDTTLRIASITITYLGITLMMIK